MPSRAPTPISQNYMPEHDISEELDPQGITLFQELVGILRWAIELGRVDIYLEVSLLSAYQASPRIGHLEQIIHIFAYLKKNPKLTLYFDPQLPRIDVNMFQGDEQHDFLELYRDAKEDTPLLMPRPRGNPVVMTAFVDASHASNKITRRSHTGFVIFLNRAPIYWYSKRQSTVETSTFSSEFIAMKACVEQIIALRYKLRMFGVAVDQPADVLCDNQSCVNNSSKVDSTLNRKHCSLAYHFVRHSVAAGIIRVGKIHTSENLADAFTKVLTRNQRESLFGNWTY